MKHGALWLDTETRTGAELVGEHYDPDADLLGAVFAKGGVFLVVVYEKIRQPDGSTLRWTPRGPQNWLQTIEDATSYMIEAVRAGRTENRRER